MCSSNRLEELLILYHEEGQREKINKWEDSVARVKDLMGSCEDKLADLKSKGDPKDKKEVEEQIDLANVSFDVIFHHDL